jgi:hypothetical protein
MKKAIACIGVFAFISGILLIALPSANVLKTTSEANQVPKSTVLVDRYGLLGPSFGVVAPTADWADGFTFTAGDLLNIQVNVNSSKRIDFFVCDEISGVNSCHVGASTYLSYPNVTLVNTDWVVPKNSGYNFVFSSSGTVSANDVHWQINKLWNETDYRNVTQNTPLLPFQVVFVGVVVALSGLAIAVLGIITPKKRITN